MFTKIPKEDKQEGDGDVVGELRLSHSKIDKGIAVMVHGHDYMCAGPEESLKELRDQLPKAFEIKSAICGEDPHLEKEGNILNRII